MKRHVVMCSCSFSPLDGHLRCSAAAPVLLLDAPCPALPPLPPLQQLVPPATAPALHLSLPSSTPAAAAAAATASPVAGRKRKGREGGEGAEEEEAVGQMAVSPPAAQRLKRGWFDKRVETKA